MTARLRTFGAAAAIAAAVAGCGSRPQSEVQESACVRKFNLERAADIGLHSYADHGARTARVYRIAGECAVMFVVPPTDAEYGGVGEFFSGGRWRSTIELPDAVQVQSDAAEQPNAEVDPTGHLKLR